MNYLEQTKKFFSNNKTQNFKKSNLNVNNHWEILVSIFSLITIALIIFSLYLFYQIKNDEVFQADDHQINQEDLINKKLLKKIQDYSSEKNQVFENLKEKPLKIEDPSL